uniref:MATH domain-containing protein n=1 Tax=Arundo donax TaxID=35708 RepID=A0A0A9H1A1_ARUDO
MVASQAPIPTTASTCTPQTARGRHLFEITGYSLLKGLGVGDYIESDAFTVGGHDWCISYSPNGDEEYQEYASVFLMLQSETSTMVTALYHLRLLDPATGVSSSVHTDTRVFNDKNPSCGAVDFMERSKLEASYLRDDRLVIECNVTVIMGTAVCKSGTICAFEIHVPPSDVLDSLGKLLDSAEGADVTFRPPLDCGIFFPFLYEFL